MDTTPSPQALSTAIQCIECSRTWADAAERWHLKLLADEEPELVPYCPDCHVREFESI